jgi:hypothetical protein
VKELLYRPRPHRDESLSGYILRLTDENNYENSTWIYGFMDIPKKKIVKLTPYKGNLKSLGMLTEVKEEELWKLTYYYDLKESNEMQYNKAFNYGVNNYIDKFCPKCLNQHMYHKRIWNYSINMLCIEHNCLLISHCPHCQKGISPTRKKLSECDCGYNLSNLPIIKIYDNHLQHMGKTINDIYSKKVAQESNIFLGLNFVQVINLIITLWFRKKGCNINEKLNHNLSLQNLSHFNSLKETYYIFNNWPNNYYDFLKSLINHSETGYAKAHGRFYKELFLRSLSGSEFQYLRDEFDKYILKTWHKPIKMGDRNLEESEFISGEQAMKVMGIDRRKLNYLIEKKLIEAKKVKKNDYTHTSITSQSVEKYLNYIEKYVSCSEAMEILDVPRKRIYDLCEYGLLMANDDFTDYFTGGYKLYSLSCINQILINLESKLNLSIKVPNSDRVGFGMATNIAHTRGIHICELLLEGKLLPISQIKGKGLERYRFSREILMGGIKELREKKFKLGTLACTAKEAAQWLIIPNVMYISDWNKRGYFGKKGRQEFYISDLEEFRSKYITLIEISANHGTNPTYMLKRLNKAGISPVTGKQIDGGMAYLYLKEKIDEAEKL